MPVLPSGNLLAKLEILEARIGYRFKNKKILVEALTHRSFAKEEGIDFDNERLEFLGDAFLNYVVGKFLFYKYLNFSEGLLTRKRSEFVREEALAFVAKRIGLGDFLFLGKGEALQGGAERVSNLADAFEALIGAVLVDGGVEAAENVVKKVLIEPGVPSFIDYKSVLYMECAKRKLNPAFRVSRDNGLFRVELEIPGFRAVFFAKNKREGEREASKAALSWFYLSSSGLGVAQDSSSK